MAQIINLRQARKARARSAAETTASANRAKFGRTKAQKLREDQDARRSANTLEGARREDTD